MSTLAKYRLLLGPQVTASVNASVNTSVDLSHPRVLGAASYVYYENGSVITPTMTGTSTLTGTRTGRANGQSYQYQVAAVDSAGREGPKSSAATVNIPPAVAGVTFTLQKDLSFDSGILTNNAGTSTVGAYLLSGPNAFGAYDNFDTASGDTPCTLSTTRVRYTPAGGTGRSLRAQVTFHKGPSTFPQTSSRTYVPSIEYYFKGGAAEGTDEQAHRNEVSVSGLTLIAETEYWLGFSIYLVGANDPLGDPQFQPFSFFGGYCIGPQLHGPTGGYNPCLPLYHGAGSYPSTQAHPDGAPVVKYVRGRDTFGGLAQGSSADTLTVQWTRPLTGAAPTGYRIYTAPRSTGPWASTLDTGPGTLSYTVTGLGRQDAAPSTMYVRVHAIYDNGGYITEGPGSLVCPGPRKHWSCPMWGHNSDLVSEGTSWNAGAVDADLGHWTDWVFRYRLSVNRTGFFQAWKNDVQVAWFSGINLGEGRRNPAVTGPVELTPNHYWKFGIYHGHPTDDTSPVPADWPKRHVIYYDECKHGTVTRPAGPVVAVGTNDPGYLGVKPRGTRT